MNSIEKQVEEIYNLYKLIKSPFNPKTGETIKEDEKIPITTRISNK